MRNLLLAALLSAPAAAQPPSAPVEAPQAAPAAGLWDPATRLTRQREAMKALSFMDGVWRGSAEAEAGGGALVQTERVGPLLDGTVKLVEGRAYDAAGKTVFNALGVISYDPVKRAYVMHAYAESYSGDFPLTVRPDGFTWTQPMGPGATLRYTAIVKDGQWHEVGERIVDGVPPAKLFEMRLRRIGPARWPTEGAVTPR